MIDDRRHYYTSENLLFKGHLEFLVDLWDKDPHKQGLSYNKELEL